MTSHLSPVSDLAEEAERLVDAENNDISDIRWVDAPVFFLFWLLISVVFVQFFTRYVLNSSFSWTEEVARYLLISIAYVGGIICARKNSHIALDFMYKYMSPKVQRAVLVFVDLITAGFFLVLSWLGVQLATRLANQRMVSIDFPRSAVFWVVTVSLAISACVVLFRCYRRIRG